MSSTDGNVKNMKIKYRFAAFFVALAALAGAWKISNMKTVETPVTNTELARQFLAIYRQGQNKPLFEVQHELTAALARTLPIGTPIGEARAMLIKSGFTITEINKSKAAADVLSAAKVPFVTDGLFFKTWSCIYIQLHGIEKGTITGESVSLGYSFPEGC